MEIRCVQNGFFYRAPLLILGVSDWIPNSLHQGVNSR